MLTQHPLSAAFPSMSPADLSALADDIATHGLRQPVVTFEGQVLDGWHRYSACLSVGVDPTLTEYQGDDPAAFVLSLNLSRRHLSASQRAAAVVACSEWRPRGDQRSAAAADRATDMAEKADVSPRTIGHAKAAQRAGLGEAVRDGRVSAERAAEVAKLPVEERAAALEAPPKRRMRFVDEPPPPKAAPAVPAPPPEEEQDDPAGRAADIVAEYEALLRICEGDDKAGEAWAECKVLIFKLEEMSKLYDSKCIELAVMTKEAKRHARRAEALEKKLKAFEAGELK